MSGHESSKRAIGARSEYESYRELCSIASKHACRLRMQFITAGFEKAQRSSNAPQKNHQLAHNEVCGRTS